MKKIKFSVLMSVYKGDEADNVKVAVDSLINQTLVPDQIVIIADGPISEKVEKLLKEYQKNEIFNIYFRKENLGLGLTLKEGIEYCKYNYIARMDADDYSMPNRFEKQISYLEKHPDIDVLGCNISEYDNKLIDKYATRIVPEYDSDIKKYMKKRNGMNHVTVIFKKQAVLDAGSYQNCLYFEDYYLWCRMAVKKYKFHNIQEDLMKIRAGNEMTKRRGGTQYIKHMFNFENKIRKIGFINNWEFLTNFFVRAIVSLIPNFLRTFLYKKYLRTNTKKKENITNIEDMKILHISNIDNDKTKGTSVIIPNIIRYQKEKNKNIFVLNCKNCILDCFESNEYLQYNKNNIEDFIIKHNPSIVVFHEVYIPSYLKIYKILKKHEIPYIIVPHGCLTKQAQSHKKIKKIFGNLFFFNKFINNSKAIHYLSENEKEKSLYKKENFVINNGIFYKESKQLYTVKKNTDLNLIYVGRYDIRIKGLDSLIKAFYKNEDKIKQMNIHLNMYGVGDISKLKTMIKQAKMENYIKINNGIFGDKKINTILENDAFIQVSRSEGLPTGLIEAMSIGMPIIASDGTGFSKIIEKYNCGSSCITDETSIFNAILGMYNNKKEFKEFSNNAFSYAKEHFDWDKISNETLKKYYEFK